MNCTRACAVVLKLGMKKKPPDKIFPITTKIKSTPFYRLFYHRSPSTSSGSSRVANLENLHGSIPQSVEYGGVCIVLCTISAYSTSNNYVHSESHIYPVRGHVRGLTAHVQCRLGSGIAFSNPQFHPAMSLPPVQQLQRKLGLGSKVSFHSRTCSQREATVVGIQHV